MWFGTILMALSQGAFAQDDAPRAGGTAVLAIPADPSIMLRNVSTRTVDGAMACIVYQGLMESDAEGNPVPLLAKEVETSPDAKTYTFHLHEANWHDGQRFTSEDVRFTLEEVSARYSAVFSRMAELIEAIDTPDDRTVIIRLKSPVGPLLNSLTCLQGTGILPAHIFQGTDVLSNPAAQQPVGTGAFKMSEWVRGSHLRFVKNEDYWEDGKPHLDEVVAQIIPTSAGRTQALLSGDVDRIAWMGMEVSNYPLIEANPQTALAEANMPPAANYIFLNTERPLISDKRVRQALFMALDRDYIRQAAFRNVGEVGTMPFPAGIAWAADESVDYRTMYPFDPERAGALLDEAGHPRGADGTRFRIDLVYNSAFNGGNEIAASLRNMWGAIGVDLNITSLEPAAASQRVYMDGDFDVFFIGYSSQGDPALGVSSTYHSNAIGLLSGNASRYANPAIDALFDEGLVAPTLEDRAAIYKEIQRVLADELPVLTLTEQQHFDAQSVDLKGMENEFNHAHWRDAWLDR